MEISFPIPLSLCVWAFVCVCASIGILSLCELSCYALLYFSFFLFAHLRQELCDEIEILHILSLVFFCGTGTGVGTTQRVPCFPTLRPGKVGAHPADDFCSRSARERERERHGKPPSDSAGIWPVCMKGSPKCVHVCVHVKNHHATRKSARPTRRGGHWPAHTDQPKKTELW